MRRPLPYRSALATEGAGVLVGDVESQKPIGSFQRRTSIVVLAWAVRFVSLFNVVNALLRYQPKFIDWLGKWVPFEISEGHRIRILLMSVLLIVLASGLERGKRLAWEITIAGLLFVPILHLGRIVIWPQAMVNLVLVGFLLLNRRYFVVQSDTRSIRFALIICPFLALALLVFGAIRLHALHKHTKGDHTWFGSAQASLELVVAHKTHTLVAQTPRSNELFTILRTGGTLIALGGLLLVLRPVLFHPEVLGFHRRRVRRLIARLGNDALDPYALLEDKSYFFSEGGHAFIPYVKTGNLAVALADPIGLPNQGEQAINEFTHFCRKHDWEPVFYQIAEDFVHIYEAAGFCAFKIGEEARLQVEHFHLKGGDYQNLRTAQNMARKLNQRFRYYSAAEGIDEDLERELAEISEQWLAAKNAREMTFDMGCFSIRDIRQNGAGVAFDAAGRAIAFATWRPFAQDSGRCLDLMRARPECRNVMDFVLVESIQHFREVGVLQISLGTAPLANVDSQAEPLLAEEKVVRFLYENLNRIYGYKSLFEFKRKYRPEWRGRYVAYRRGVHLPLVGLGLLRVHAPAGLWRFLGRSRN